MNSDGNEHRIDGHSKVRSKDITIQRTSLTTRYKQR